MEHPDYSTAGDTVRVLIVDDVKSARNLLKEILDTDPRFLVELWTMDWTQWHWLRR